jgi:hypothetical protein
VLVLLPRTATAQVKLLASVESSCTQPGGAVRKTKLRAVLQIDIDHANRGIVLSVHEVDVSVPTEAGQEDQMYPEIAKLVKNVRAFHRKSDAETQDSEWDWQFAITDAQGAASYHSFEDAIQGVQEGESRTALMIVREILGLFYLGGHAQPDAGVSIDMGGYKSRESDASSEWLPRKFHSFSTVEGDWTLMASETKTWGDGNVVLVNASLREYRNEFGVCLSQSWDRYASFHLGIEPSRQSSITSVFTKAVLSPLVRD